MLGGNVSTCVDHFFERPLPEPDQAYRWRLEWRRPGVFRFWVDDEPMLIDGGAELPMFLAGRRYEAIDTLCLHPGFATSRETLAERRAGRRRFENVPVLTAPHRTWWAFFRVRRDALPEVIVSRAQSLAERGEGPTEAGIGGERGI